VTQEPIPLADQTPFSRGGNRLCFVHPRNPHRCLKVLNPTSTPELKRQDKGFPANLRPLRYFDENLQEYAALEAIHRNYPEEIRRHLPKTYGIVLTDLGHAHEVDLIRDRDGRIGETLEQYLWNKGLDRTVERSMDTFAGDWLAGALPTRALLPHNIVIRHMDQGAVLILIDGYGRKPSFKMPRFWSRMTSRKTLKDFKSRVDIVLKRKKDGEIAKPRISILERSM